uniref:Uncharacterized protein n=1 Tax=Rhizophora mucronata TaxID=61149 RepID=A0A2P2KJM3_RHIMU
MKIEKENRIGAMYKYLIGQVKVECFSYLMKGKNEKRKDWNFLIASLLFQDEVVVMGAKIQFPFSFQLSVFPFFELRKIKQNPEMEKL